MNYGIINRWCEDIGFLSGSGVGGNAPDTGSFDSRADVGAGNTALTGATSTEGRVEEALARSAEPQTQVRHLNTCEKTTLAPYIPQVDLDAAILHDGKVP